MATVAEPIIVLYKSSVCKHCTALSNIWDTPPINGGQESVVTELKKIYPKLRFHVLTAKDNLGKFDENTSPKDLMRYGKWFPMILLCPGKLWDSAMAKLGPKNDIELVEGVQIMNGKWEAGQLKYVQKYDIRKPSEFGNWLKESLDNEDFKRVQNSSGAHPVVPTINTPAQPIQPLLTNIVKPVNAATTYVSTGTVDRNSAMEPTGDICSMRIISRPR